MASPAQTSPALWASLQRPMPYKCLIYL